MTLKARDLGAWCLAMLGLAAQVGAGPQPPQAAPPQTGPARPTASPPPGEPQQPIFRTGVGSVLVDVTVTGRDDRPVGDLTPDDFELTEDGERQTVDLAQFVHLDGISRPDGDSLDIRSQEHARAEAARDDVRLFAIFLDDYHLDRSPPQMIPLRKGLTDFLKTMMGPTDLVTVMDPITPLSALQWTRNRLALADKLHTYEGRLGNYEPRSVIEEGHLRTRNVPLVRAQVTLSAMSALVAHLGALREGRKSILLVSHGIPLVFTGTSLDKEFQDLIRLANRSNVVIHTLDPRGLHGGLADYTLAMLSGETGGRAIVNTNDIGKRLADVVQDASEYYLLGYTPNHDRADGKFHKIQVRVRRAGVRAVARRGYWAPRPDEMTSEDTAPERDPAVTAALDRLALEDTDRLVKVWTGFARAADGHPTLTVAWQPAGRREVSRTIFNRGDQPPPDTAAPEVAREPPTVLRIKVLDAAGKTLVEAEAEAPSARGAPAMVTIDVTAALARLQFSAETSSGETVDRWERRVAVPDFAKDGLVISAPQYLRARTFGELVELRRGGAAAPLAEHSFRASDLVLVRLAATGPESEAVVTAELQSRQGQRLFDLPVVRLAGGVGGCHVELPLRSLALGQYVLRITARDGDRESTQTSAFAVVR